MQRGALQILAIRGKNGLFEQMDERIRNNEREEECHEIE